MKFARLSTTVHFALVSNVGIAYFIGSLILGLATRIEIDQCERIVPNDVAPELIGNSPLSSPASFDDVLFHMPASLDDGLYMSPESFGHDLSTLFLPESYAQGTVLMKQQTNPGPKELLAERQLDKAPQTSQLSLSSRKRPIKHVLWDTGSSSFQLQCDRPLKRLQFAPGGSQWSQSYAADENTDPVTGSPLDYAPDLHQGAFITPSAEVLGQYYDMSKQDVLESHDGTQSQASYPGVLEHQHLGSGSPHDNTFTYATWSHDHYKPSRHALGGFQAMGNPKGSGQDSSKIRIDTGVLNLQLENIFGKDYPHQTNSYATGLINQDTGQYSTCETSKMSPGIGSSQYENHFLDMPESFEIQPLKGKEPQSNPVSLLEEQEETMNTHPSNFDNLKGLKNIRIFQIKEPDTKLLAWIASLPSIKSGNKIHLIQKLLNKIHENPIQENPTKLQYLLHGTTIGDKKSNITPMGLLKDLMEHIWDLNGHFLERLCLERFEDTYLLEQLEMQNWLYKIITTKITEYPMEDCSALEDDGKRNKKILDIHDQIYSLFLKDHDGAFWEIRPNFRASSSVRYERPIINLTELALNLIGSYYKSTNNRKWKVLFEAENSFCYLLSHIRYKYYTQNYNMSGQIKPPRGTNFFPWGEKWPRMNFKQYVVKEYSSLLFQIRYFVSETGKDSLSPDLEENNNTMDSNPKIYQWLSLHRNMISSSEGLILIEHEQNFTKELSKIQSYQNFLDLISFMKELTNEIWHTNRTILKSLGVLTNSNCYYEEQASLQKFIQKELLNQARFLINEKLKGSGDESRFETGCLDSFKRSFQNSRKFSDTIDSIDYFQNKIENSLIISSNKVDITRESVKLINSYYKNTNYEKWRNVFRNDNTFLAFVVRTCKFFQGRNHSETLKRRKEILKSLDILPWKKEVYLGTKSSQEKLRKALKSVLSKSAIDILEPKKSKRHQKSKIIKEKDYSPLDSENHSV